MLRIFLLSIANISLVYTDFSSASAIKVVVLPLVDLSFAIYLCTQIAIFVMNNFNNLFESMQNHLIDANWQHPAYWVRYTSEFILWCLAFAQYMHLFKKAVLS